ncbi:unnamed protein product [Symbiodinium natans]|uniref:Uncharacterized protein n=1 Tax=Symbiodinium natans TaxID=878477 RepID=A0A812IEE3_9DINO|nr:unnamed protein product [Symbiodinium natans]
MRIRGLIGATRAEASALSDALPFAAAARLLVACGPRSLRLRALREPRPGRQPIPPRPAANLDAEAVAERRREAACARTRQGELSRARQVLTSAELAPGDEATRAALTDPAKRPPQPREPIPAEVLQFQPLTPVRLTSAAVARSLRFGARAVGRTSRSLQTPSARTELRQQCEPLQKRRGPAAGGACSLWPFSTLSATRRWGAPQPCRDRHLLMRRPLTRSWTSLARKGRAACHCTEPARRTAFTQEPDLTDNQVVRVQQQGNSGSSRVTTKSNPWAGSSHCCGNAIEQDVEQQWSKDVALTDSSILVPGFRHHPVDQDSCRRATQEVIQDSPSGSCYAGFGKFDQDCISPGYVESLPHIDKCKKSALARTKAQRFNEIINGKLPTSMLHSTGRCDVVCTIAFEALELAVGLWTSTGDSEPATCGFVALGVPIGHTEFVRRTLAARLEEERRLLHELPELPDMQSAWLLLLYCASPRAQHALRTVPPLDSATYAAEHDRAIWATLHHLLAEQDASGREWTAARQIAFLPAACGGLGLASAEALRAAARSGWERRWWGQLGCALQRALASTLLGGCWRAPAQPTGDEGTPLGWVLELAEAEQPSRLPLRPIPKENRQRHLHTGFRRSLFQAYVLPAMQHGAAFLDDASVRRLEKQFIGVDVCLAGRQAPQARLRTSRRPRQTCLAVFVQLTRMVLTVVWQAAYFAMPRIVQRHGRSKFVASCVFLTFLCQMLSVLVLAVCIDQCYGISAKNTLHDFALPPQALMWSFSPPHGRLEGYCLEGNNIDLWNSGSSIVSVQPWNALVGRCDAVKLTNSRVVTILSWMDVQLGTVVYVTLAFAAQQIGASFMPTSATQGWARRWWGVLSVALQRAVASSVLGVVWTMPPLPGVPDDVPLGDVLDLAEAATPNRLPLQL